MTAQTLQTTDDRDSISAALENAAARLEADRIAREAISTRRGRMMRGEGDGGKYDASEAFYAALAIRLKLEVASPESGVTTMATDGDRLIYDPVWVAGLDHSRKGGLHGVLVHEVVHIAHQHMCRMPAECRTDPEAFRDANTAADLAINGTLLQAGFKLPQDGVFPGKGDYADFPPDLSMEQYYALIRANRAKNYQQGQDPQQQPGSANGTQQAQSPAGGIIPPSSPEQAKQMASRLKLAVAQAEQYAEGRGELSAGLQRMLDTILRPAYDLADVLNDYITRVSHDKANWNTRNRRYSDIYLPGKLNRTLGEIVLVLDTSGSISPAVLKRAAEIAQQAIEATPARLTVLCHDTTVTNEQVWERDDPPLVIDAKGGGGTDHNHVFARIASMERDGRIDLVICLTDCCTRYPQTGPWSDVVWARFGKSGSKPPFGKLVDVQI